MAAAASFDKATLAWHLPWDADWVTAVAMIGNTRRLAAGNNLGQILLWELPEKPGAATPLPVRRLDGHSNVISRLLATKDGRWLLSASYDHTIRIWDMHSAAKGEETITLNARTIEDLQRRKASKLPAKIDAKVAIQEPVKILTDHKEWVTAMCLSHDESFLLSGDDAGIVIVRDHRQNDQEVRRIQVKGWVYALGVSPDKKQAAISERLPLVFDSGRHAGMKQWDLTTGEKIRDLEADFKGQHLVAAAYSLDGKILAIARGGESDGMSGKVTLLDSATGKKLRELAPGHLNGATDIAFHPDGIHLASAGRDTMIRIWDTRDGKQVKELGKSRGGQFKDWITSISFSPDGAWIAGGDQAGGVQVYALKG